MQGSSDLRRRARAEGVAAEQLEEAADADDPKAACVELLLALHADASDDGIAELRAELEGMRLKELRRRARALRWRPRQSRARAANIRRSGPLK